MAYSSILTLVSYNTSQSPVSFSVETFAFDIEQTLNIGSQSSGAGAGKITFNPFSVTRIPDLLSPSLLTMAASGTAFKTVTLSVTPDDVTTPLVMYKLGLAAIKTMATSGNQHGGFTPIETVSFEYGSLQIAYRDLSSGQTATGAWDRVHNVSGFSTE